MTVDRPSNAHLADFADNQTFNMFKIFNIFEEHSLADPGGDL